MLSTVPQSGAQAEGAPAANGSPDASKGPPKPNDKDRTKRKKARRACSACQRAHLTCDDERPCRRCVRRKMADSCCDGARKKAKYLQDEETITITDPTKAIMENRAVPRDQSMVGGLDESQVPQPLQLNTQRPELFADDPSTTGSGWFYGLSPGFSGDPSSAFNSNYATTELHAIQQIAAMSGQMPGSAGGNSVGTPDNLSASQGLAGYSPSQGYIFPNTAGSDIMLETWTGPSRSNSTLGGIPHTFTIATGPGSIATPSPPAGSPQTTQSQPLSIYDTLSGSPRNVTGPSTFYRQSHQQQMDQQNQQNRQNALQHYSQQQGHHGHQIHTHQAHLQPHVQAVRRRMPPLDPSHVYSSVTEPYSYVEAYHRLFATIDPRFTKEKQLRIARAFSAFRPSFIASTQSLRRADLVFQEKTCQRSIHLYEASLPNIGTPTLVCRRSGEVVVVGKEFSMLSGWPKEVLLGEKPNLNTNVPHAREDEEAAKLSQRTRQRLQNRLNGNLGRDDDDKDGDDDVMESRSSATSRPQSNGPKPVFLLELLDDESVCEFYEDFSKLAFADSTGKVTKKCKILKYKAPPSPPSPEDEVKNAEDGEGGKDKRGNRKDLKKLKSNGTSAIDVLGSSTTIECMMCWTLRRDVFDIPMLIVLNFLPNLLQTSSNTTTNAQSSAHTREIDNSKHQPRGGGGGSGSAGSGGGGGGGGGGVTSSPTMKFGGGGEMVKVR
ncbi:hypothetical protein BDZ91DRAFT_166916 [Kalaharituber pfeilii]|nr:hypothetical protein BDZ91DRAFT_166916 [Kalaharituber pfeilii]